MHIRYYNKEESMQFRFWIILLFSLIFTTQETDAQKLHPVRLEVPGDLNVENYHVEPVGKQGVLVFYETNETNEEGKRLWYFALLGTKLEQKWIKSVPLDTKLDYIESAQDKGKAFFLFKNREKVSRDYDIYEIVVFHKKELHFTSITGSIPYKSEITGFEVIRNMALIGLKLEKHQVDLAFVDLSTGEIKPVHLNKEEDALIESIYADAKTRQFYVVTKYYNSVTFFKDIIYVFDVGGNEKATMEVEYPDNLRLPRNHQIASVSKSEITLLGTYDLITARRPSWKDVSESEDSEQEATSAGFFYLKFNKGKQEKLVFYDFMKFDNTYYSVHGKEVTMTKSKDETFKKVNVFYKINNPKITSLGDETVFSVELYKPKYRDETRMDYDFYGRPYPINYRIFDGYEFYDVIFAGFDKNGNMLWNNDFAISNLSSYSLGDHVMLVADNDLITLAYVNEGKIITRTFEKSHDLSDREKIPLETAFKKDRVTQDENNKMKHWYDDYYLVYGYQKLRNRSLQDKSNRTVFFINKLAFK